MSQQPKLQLSEVSVNYGPIPALRGANLEVRHGEVVAVVGPNGAGKTTLLRAIAGLEPIKSGTVQFEGASINTLPPHRRLMAGVAMVPQGRRVFAESTVEANLRAGAFARKDRNAVSADLDQVFERFQNLAKHRDSQAGVLSGGEQQMLALGRALMARPRLMLLDEPSMGLAPIMVARIYEILADLVAQGTTMLLVEQNVARALQVADSIYVLKSGQFVASRLQASSLSARDLIAEHIQELGSLATPKTRAERHVP